MPLKNIAHQNTLAQSAYEPMINQSKYDQVLHGTGYQLDPSIWVIENTNVLHNPTTREVMIGTALNRPTTWKDLRSDMAILMGRESPDRRFKQATHHFNEVANKYRDYKLNTTGILWVAN